MTRGDTDEHPTVTARSDATWWEFDDREALLLAEYAFHSRDTAGRVHGEPPHPYRAPLQRDRDRIVHLSAFRRLAHKTQVFTGEMGDYHRSRLTHTLEVASIARTAGRVLRLNEDLIEALALMHDIGHPPFGHAGEDALDECLKDHGGFNHNQQALRLVELLERRYPNFPGVNLSQEVLEGQRVRSEKNQPRTGWPLLEVQIVDAADSIAYDAHDADDAVQLGLLDLDELAETTLWAAAAERAQRRYSALDDEQFRQAAVRELLGLLVGDLLKTSRQRLDEASPSDSRAAQDGPTPLVGLSDEMQEQKDSLEQLLFDRVYRHPTVLEQRHLAVDALKTMYQRLCSQPSRLPGAWAVRIQAYGLERTVVDYLACMTDRYAWDAHRRCTRDDP